MLEAREFRQLRAEVQVVRQNDNWVEHVCVPMKASA